MSDQAKRKNAILLVVAVVILAAAGYLIFGRGSGEAPSPNTTAAQAQADQVGEAMRKAGVSDAPPPDIQRPSRRGAVSASGK